MRAQLFSFSGNSPLNGKPAQPPNSLPVPSFGLSRDVFVPRPAFGQNADVPRLEIKPAGLTDVPALVDLQVRTNTAIPGLDSAKEEAKREGYAKHYVRRIEWARNHPADAMVEIAKKKTDGQPVGFLFAKLLEGGDLRLIMYTGGAKRRATVRQLGAAGLAWADKNGYGDETRLRLYVVPSDEKALALYKQLGFREVSNPDKGDYKLMMAAPLGTVRRNLERL